MDSFCINSDIGEGFGNWKMGRDDEVMPHITAANVACGFHAGDPRTIQATVGLARQNDVAVGAHPGFPDLLGFGRRRIAISPEDAAAYITYQAGAVREFLRPHGLELHHVKPHGAFYVLLSQDDSLAEACAQAIADLDVMCYFAPVLGDIRFVKELEARGVEVVGEVYPDLHYGPDGKLIIQGQKLETDLDFAAHQVKLFLEKGVVEATDGSEIPMKAGSACIHSDGPNAPEVAIAIRKVVEDAGLKVAAPQPTDEGAAR